MQQRVGGVHLGFQRSFTLWLFAYYHPVCLYQAASSYACYIKWLKPISLAAADSGPFGLPFLAPIDDELPTYTVSSVVLILQKAGCVVK